MKPRGSRLLNLSSLVIVVVAVLIRATSTSNESFICNPKDCSCGSSTLNMYSIICPKSSILSPESILTVEFQPKKSVTFICTNSSVNYDWLAGAQLGQASVVSFQSCPLPTNSVHELMMSLGITNVTKLKFQSNMNISAALKKHHFNGLTAIKTLVLSLNGFDTLPENLFRDMTNLTTLDLRSNAINLNVHLFHNIPNLKRLELGMNNINHIESGVFKNLKQLELLNLWGNKIENLTRESFTGLHSLTSLDLSSNGITSLQGDVFADLGSMKNLSLNGNNFTSLSDGLFSGMPLLEEIKLHNNYNHLASIPSGLLGNLTVLKEVYLNNCNISQLPEDIFWGSKNITVLHLFNNDISHLPELIFRDAYNLAELDIRYNKLDTLPDKIFSSLNKLHILKLGHNHLTVIPRTLFQQLLQLEELGLENNVLQHIHVEAFRHTQMLKYLHLRNNHLSFKTQTNNSWSPLQHCNNLEVLELSNNSICEVFTDWRIAHKNLRWLNLSYNKINSVQFQDFNFISNEITVDLSHNNISIIDLNHAEEEAIPLVGFASEHTYNTKVHLNGNPISCNCDVYNFLRYLEFKISPEVHAVVELMTENVQCASPKEMAGVLVRKLSSQKLTCPWNSEESTSQCPKLCSCILRPEERALLVNCSYVGLKQVPATLPDSSIILSIELDLSNNFLETLPDGLLPGYSKISKLLLSHNNITELSYSFLPPMLKVIEVNHNKLTNLEERTIESLSNVCRLTLHSNPWYCNCKSVPLLNFLKTKSEQVASLHRVNCDNEDGTVIVQLSESDLCARHLAFIGASVAIVIASTVIGLLAALYIHYQRRVRARLYTRNKLQLDD